MHSEFNSQKRKYQSRPQKETVRDSTVLQQIQGGRGRARPNG